MLLKINCTFFFILLFISSWSQTNTPPTLIASGNQPYCPGSTINIVTDFDITDPDDSQINAIFIQISTGYVEGEDTLSLLNNHPNIVTSWNVSEGKLALTGMGSNPISYVDVIAAIKDVVFESTSPTASGEKFFSFTIGLANFLPSTQHYYEYVPDVGITWTDAKVAAESRTYFGLQGYLATITSAEEAQLSGEQAAGAGWIGGSDAETEGVWKWVTGPENGTVFWNGGINGSTPNFAFWNTNEPNNLNDEDYAHVTAPNIGIRGSWNDLPNPGTTGDFEPKGYIVEYGGTVGDPVLNLSASTRIYIPLIDTVEESERCGPGEVILSAASATGTIHWYDANEGGTLLYTGPNYTTPSISQTITFYAISLADGCTTGARTPIIATIKDLPTIQSSIVFKNCDEDGTVDGFTDFNLNEATSIITQDNIDLNVTYHLSYNDADSNSGAINPSPFNNSTSDTVYARVENSEGCHQVSTINLQVSTTSFPEGYSYKLSICDDDIIDGFLMFDLTQVSDDIINQFPSGQNLSVRYYNNLADAQLEENEISPQNNYTNKTPFSETLFVRVENENDGSCFGIGPYLELTVFPRPQFEVPSEAIVCLNLSPIVIETFNERGIYTYEWSDEGGVVISNDPTAAISRAGIYTVIATSGLNCESIPQTINVKESIIAEITEEDITVIDDSDDNSISINSQNNNLGIGDYEFALDSNIGPYQDEPFYENVPPGIHTLYVRDKNKCGIVHIYIPVIGFPKFLTPNNDGFNDTWEVKGVDPSFFESISVNIYDRFGRMIATIDPTIEKWDGTYNGNPLPETDYWYSAQLIDNKGNVHHKEGHFSLIIR